MTEYIDTAAIRLMDRCHKTCELMNRFAYRLDDIAHKMSLFFPGSPVITQLQMMRQQLEQGAEELDKACGEEVSECVQNADKNSRAMLEAVLVGLQAGKETKEQQ